MKYCQNCQGFRESLTNNKTCLECSQSSLVSLSSQINKLEKSIAQLIEKVKKEKIEEQFIQELQGIHQVCQEFQAIQKTEVPPGMPMSQWALQWCLQNPLVSCVIPGSKDVAQLEANPAMFGSDVCAVLSENLRDYCTVFKVQF